MSKIICDVCGTAYPETAAVCPICGCAKNTTTPTAAAETVEEGEGAGYNYVKGGRFSKRMCVSVTRVRTSPAPRNPKRVRKVPAVH